MTKKTRYLRLEHTGVKVEIQQFPLILRPKDLWIQFWTMTSGGNKLSYLLNPSPVIIIESREVRKSSHVWQN